jgi:hypothetical protein
LCRTCEKASYSLIDEAYLNLLYADILVEKVLGIKEISRIAKSEIRLRKYLEKKWNVRRNEAIKSAVELARNKKSYKTISSSINAIMNKWSRDVLPVYNSEMREVYKLARIAGYKKASGKTKASLQFNVPKTSKSIPIKKADSDIHVDFDLVDENTIEALENKNIFWVGEHYDKNISDSVKDTAKSVMVEAGESTSLAGQLMGERIKDILSKFSTPGGFVGTEKQYFEGLVSNAMTVGRVYGQMRSFSQIGITRYEIVNPGGDRICEVCANIQGTTFDIKQGLEQITKEFKSSSPEDIKKIHPWVGSSKVIGKSSDSLASMGLSLPPYHFRCRCTIDVSSEVESFEDLTPISFPIPPKTT